jgi:hypothetical protein
LLYTILLFIGPRYPAILLYYSSVILGGACSTHPLRKERNRKLNAGVTVTWVEYERKVKSGNAEKGWSSVEGMNAEA